MDFLSLFTPSRLQNGLQVFYAVCLVTIIILIVTLRNPGEPDMDRTLEYQIGNLSMEVNSKLGHLSQEGEKITEKLKDMDKSVVEILTDKTKESLQSDMQSVLKSLETLSNRVRKLILNGTVEESCPEGWFYYSLSCYYVSKVAKSWADSSKLCEGKNAHLVVINSDTEEVCQ
uniref:Uncharacterized protein n=1 Tax=Leptobrachium leishanense TaxID=445787 RepID=A0A8C5QFM6_9ANUR